MLEEHLQILREQELTVDYDRLRFPTSKSVCDVYCEIDRLDAHRTQLIPYLTTAFDGVRDPADVDAMVESIEENNWRYAQERDLYSYVDAKEYDEDDNTIGRRLSGSAPAKVTEDENNDEPAYFASFDAHQPRDFHDSSLHEDREPLRRRLVMAH